MKQLWVFAFCIFSASVIRDACASDLEHNTDTETETYAKIDTETETETETENNIKPSFLSKPRLAIGESYLGVANALDNFFSGQKIENEIDNSYLKLELGGTYFDRGEVESNTQLKFRLDLPKTEHRLRIFFESELNEDEEIEQRIRSVSNGNQIRRDTSTVGLALRQAKKSQTLIQTSLSVGARFDSGIKTYYRLRFRNRNTKLGRWRIRARQDFWYLVSAGWGATSRLEFKRTMGENRYFLSISDAEFRESTDQWVVGQRWIINQKYSDNFGVDYKLGHIVNRPENAQFERHFINFSLRWNLYKNWLFVSVAPEVAHIYEDKWESEKSLTVKFDLFFTD